MAKAKTKTKTKGDEAVRAGELTNDAAKASDVGVAAALPPSAVTPVRSVSSALVALLGDPALQAKLKSLESQLRAFKQFKGQSVAASIALAKEGQALTGVADRLENSVARVHARGVAINKALTPFITALAQCAENASADSDVASALAAFATARHQHMGIDQGIRTRRKNKREKKA